MSNYIDVDVLMAIHIEKFFVLVALRFRKFSRVNLPLMANLPDVADTTKFIVDPQSASLSLESKLDPPSLADLSSRRG
jgi:hypothetical protein